MAANTLSYIIAVVINYFLNKKYVFKTVNNEKLGRCIEFVKFFVVRMISLLIDNSLFYLVVDILHVNIYLGRIALSTLIIMSTFVINKVFVFKKK